MIIVAWVERICIERKLFKSKYFFRLWIDVLTGNNEFSFSAGLWRKRDEEKMRRFWRLICWSFCAGGQSWPNPQAIRLDLSSDANMASIISYYGRPSLMRNFITIFGNNKTMFWPDRGCHICYIWGPDSGVVWLIGWPNSQSETCRTSASWPNQNLLAKGGLTPVVHNGLAHFGFGDFFLFQMFWIVEK